MQKKILITGATDGIGAETAKILIQENHHLLLHGRNSEKMEALVKSLLSINSDAKIEQYIADLSKFDQIFQLAHDIKQKHTQLDILLNNAGVLATKNPITADGLDVRFVVNTIGPYLLTKKLLPLLDKHGRVINLSSAAQSPVNCEALLGNKYLTEMEAYSQSKLAITMWTHYMAQTHPDTLFVAVNPGSLLGSKMVKQAFGMDGKDLKIGADILIKASLSDEFENASGKYFDNDSGKFGDPHPDGLDNSKIKELMNCLETFKLDKN